MKKIMCVALVALLSIFSVACTATEKTKMEEKNLSQANIQESLETTLSASTVEETKAVEANAPSLGLGKRLENLEVQKTLSDYVAIRIKDGGDILVKLMPEAAPKTVENFQSLVEKQFYNGLIFHRIVPNFVIQGGDPLGNGTGGSENNIKGEFLDNGFYNPLNHSRGVLSMARSGHPDSASSQFFIVLDSSAAQHLNGKYASFGYVIHGMDVVDAIAKVERDHSDKPLTDVVMEEVVFVQENFAKQFEK